MSLSQANPHHAASSSLAPAASTLYVDLDGTLIDGDLLVEAVVSFVRANPLRCLLVLFWACRGPARLKAEIASRCPLDCSRLPFNMDVVELLRQEAATGRRIVLATAADGRYAAAVAEHLAVFDHVLASTALHNLSGLAKLAAIRRDCGDRPFAYAGNAAPDLLIWKHAQDVICVNVPFLVLRRLRKLKQPSRIITTRPTQLRGALAALRLHQWAKNLLMFIPLLASHDLDPARWAAACLGFLAFGLCASSTYVVNDLLDLNSDRAHPRKRHRPFAAGVLSVQSGIFLVLALFPASLLLAWSLSTDFLHLLVLYTAITLAYSLRIKRLALIDVVVLALLYVHRVIAGGAVSEVPISNWLLAVSLFMFLSLALVKRCAELEFMNESGADSVAGRGYRSTDLPYLTSMGVASGFAALMVLALYIDSQSSAAMYPRAHLLWLLLPLLMYWIMRLWLKTSRMQIHDDPLLFAIRDKASWLVAACIGLVAVAASTPGGAR